jgi:hypothetical protein
MNEARAAILMAAWLRLVALLAIVFATAPAPAGEQAITDANLITALDVSGSIKDRDLALELEGMAQAVTHPLFLQAVEQGRHGRIGFVAFTWSSGDIRALVPWTLIGSRTEAERVAQALLKVRRMHRPGDADLNWPWRSHRLTDVSGALEWATRIGAVAPYVGGRTVINMCANGTDNTGAGPDVARDVAAMQGVSINGLILGNRDDSAEVAAWFRHHVQTGDRSFVIEARDFGDVIDAMLAKFVMDLVALEPLRVAG